MWVHRLGVQKRAKLENGCVFGRSALYENLVKHLPCVYPFTYTNLNKLEQALINQIFN